MASDRQFNLDDHGRGAQNSVDVAITLPDDGDLGIAAGREFPGLGVGRKQDGQFLDVDRDEIRRVLCHIGIIGEDGGDRLADVSHLLGRQHRLAIGFERGNWSLTKIDGRHVGNVGRGPHRDHAGQRARNRGRISLAYRRRKRS